MLEKKINPLEKLYRTGRWSRMKDYVIDRENGICQRCGKLIIDNFIVHHKTIATKENFFDSDNLELLCLECHNHVTFVDNVRRSDSQIYTIKETENTDLISFPGDNKWFLTRLLLLFRFSPL